MTADLTSHIGGTRESLQESRGCRESVLRKMPYTQYCVVSHKMRSSIRYMARVKV